jgi:hypothetical protein
VQQLSEDEIAAEVKAARAEPGSPSKSLALTRMRLVLDTNGSLVWLDLLRQ